MGKQLYNLQVSVSRRTVGKRTDWRGMGPAGSNIVIVKCINTKDSCFKSKGPIVILTGQTVILWQYLTHITAPGPRSEDFHMEMRISTEEDFFQSAKETEMMKWTGDFRPCALEKTPSLSFWPEKCSSTTRCMDQVSKSQASHCLLPRPHSISQDLEVDLTAVL